jgi:serine/threonine protein phosphatase PrpC
MSGECARTTRTLSSRSISNGHDVRYLGKTGEASLGTGDFVFAVSDGMGGAKSGEFASRITVDRVTRLLPRALPDVRHRTRRAGSSTT